MNNLRWLAAGCAFAMLACESGPKYNVTINVIAPAAARPAKCAFELLTDAPARAYIELAVVDYSWRAATATEFRTEVAKEVCALGGDAVIMEASQDGNHTRGRVIHWK